jgi:hypothetical protein
MLETVKAVFFLSFVNSQKRLYIYIVIKSFNICKRMVVYIVFLFPH